MHDVDGIFVEDAIDSADLSLVNPRERFVQRPVSDTNWEQRAARFRTFTSDDDRVMSGVDECGVEKSQNLFCSTHRLRTHRSQWIRHAQNCERHECPLVLKSQDSE